MTQLNRLAFALLAFCCAATAASGQSRSPRVKIPFRVTPYNNIVIQAVLNNRDTVQLMLHTASSGVTLTEAALANLKTVTWEGRVDGVQSWGGGDNTSAFSKGNAISIGSLHRTGITVWTDKNSGQESDGKFGLDVFENSVLDFDFDKNTLTVTSSLPRKAKKYEKLRLEPADGDLFLPAVCQIGNDSFPQRFLIHSGYGGAILLDDKFANDTQIGQHIRITGEKKLSDAYGNVLTTKKGLLPLFRIGNYALRDAPVGFFEGKIGRQQLSVIGGDILKRFNWILDAQRQYIYIRPSRLFAAGYANL